MDDQEAAELRVLPVVEDGPSASPAGLSTAAAVGERLPAGADAGPAGPAGQASGLDRAQVEAAEASKDERIKESKSDSKFLEGIELQLDKYRSSHPAIDFLFMKCSSVSRNWRSFAGAALLRS